MAAEIQRRTGLPADEEIVDLALAELVDAGLVVLDDPEPRSTVTRRSLIRRLSLSAAAMMMLPVVETILVPPQTAAQSPGRSEHPPHPEQPPHPGHPPHPEHPPRHAPVITPTPEPTATATRTATPEPTATATRTATPEPTATATRTATPEPTAT